MVNRGYIMLGALALTGLAVALVAGHHPWDGPELFGITETHGVNLGDLPIIGAWIAGSGYFLWRLRVR